MDTAAWLVSACALAVQTGWQPADEAPQTYEYSIAVDADTAARLAAGDDLELAVDLPQDLQRVSRIRLLVGEEALPRQRRVTAMKPPLPAGAKLTQQYQPHAAPFDPYAVQPTAAQPTGDQFFAGASGASGNASWPAAPVSPSAAARYGDTAARMSQDAANQFQQAAGQAATQFQANAANQFNTAVNQAATPVRDAWGRVDERVRSAASNLGDRSREVLHGVTQPLGGQGLFPANSRAAAATQPLGPPWAPSLVQTAPVNTAATWPTRPAAAPTATPTPANPWGTQPSAGGNAPTPAGGWAGNSEFAAGAPQPTPASPATNPAWPYASSGQAPPTPATASQPTVDRYGRPLASAPSVRERIDQPISPQDAGQWYGSTRPAQPTGQPQGPIVAVGDQRGATGPTVANDANPYAAYPNAANPNVGNLAAGNRPPATAGGGWPNAPTQPGGNAMAPGGAVAAAPPATQPSWMTSTAPAPGTQGNGWPSDRPYAGNGQTPRVASQPGGAPNYDGAGPQFPNLAMAASSAGNPAAAQPGGAGPPTVTKEMLAGSAAQPLEENDSLWPTPEASAPWPPLASPTTGPTITPASSAAQPGGQPAAADAIAAAGTNGAAPDATAFGWDSAADPAAAPAAPTEGSNAIPVIVAWTLLISSVAGNAYLLWSYLDVRTKYRTQVRRNGHGVRSRFSAA